MEDLPLFNPEGSVLRRAQMRMFEILDVFDAICRKHSINYWLACGTSLGARRHGGFIPWDDDLDVAVLKSDFKRMVSILNEELPENLRVHARETDEKFTFYFAKIRDTRSVIYNEKRDFLKYKGIFIDIFPIDPLPSITLKKLIDQFFWSEINLITEKSLYSKIKYSVIFAFLPIIHVIIRLLFFYSKYIRNSKVYTFSYGSVYYSKFNRNYFFRSVRLCLRARNIKIPVILTVI